MEHLPTRSGAVTPIFPPIPYICEHEYDGGSFLDYPQRVGLPRLENIGMRHSPNLSLENARYLASMPRTKSESFLQTWLFFGLLHEVLGDLYHMDDFLTVVGEGDESETTVITTPALVPLLERWEAAVKQNTDVLMALYEHVAKCLTLTYATLIAQNLTVDNNLRFLLASVAELLKHAARKACNVAWTDSPARSLDPIFWGNSISRDFRKSILLERSNCCPSQVPMLIEDFGSPQSLAFVASCYHQEVDISDHASCSDSFCGVGGSTRPDHITRHVEESCECDFIHVNEMELEDCLKKGSLPLIRLKKGSTMDELSVEVVASNGSIPYVALSHVWVDGLGNTTATALPRCQLSRLKMLIDNLNSNEILEFQGGKPELLLWCDTICCPVKSTEGKKLALSQMYRTYDEAFAVLVLDEGIISRRVGSMNYDEACLRVATSRWMTRLWTLQEGVLPAKKDKLWFQFKKNVVSLRMLYEHIVAVQEKSPQRRSIADNIIGRFHILNHFYDIERPGHVAELKDVMKGLLYRAVTVPTDEPLIIATLLSLDLNRLLAREPSDRMRTLWEMLGTSPSGIRKQLLFHSGPRLTAPGFRWALQTLLCLDSHFALANQSVESDLGYLMPKYDPVGLLVPLASFQIQIATPARGLPERVANFKALPDGHQDRRTLLMRDDEGNWYIINNHLPGTSHAPPNSEDLCAIISKCRSPRILYCGSRSLLPDNTKAHRGLLVQEANEQSLQNDDIICVEIKSQVSFGRIRSEMHSMLTATYALTQELISSSAGRRLGDFASSTTDVNDLAWQEAAKAFDVELKRLSRSPAAVNALAASGRSADERGIRTLYECMERFYLGRYVDVGEYASDERKWCVD